MFKSVAVSCLLGAHSTLQLFVVVVWRKLSFLISFVYHYLRTLCLGKNWCRNFDTYLHVQTDIGKFALRFCGPQGRCQESYLPAPRLYKKHAQKLGYKCLIYYSCELWPYMGRTLSRDLNQFSIMHHSSIQVILCCENFLRVHTQIHVCSELPWMSCLFGAHSTV